MLNLQKYCMFQQLSRDLCFVALYSIPDRAGQFLQFVSLEGARFCAVSMEFLHVPAIELGHVFWLRTEFLTMVGSLWIISLERDSVVAVCAVIRYGSVICRR